MRIDQTHRPWITAVASLFALATIGFIVYAASSTNGPSGGSAVGLTFGIAGYAMMLFAGLLGARKKVPVWRLGRAQTWMRGHIWFGLLSFPVIVYHAGFVWKGPLTIVLMLLFFVVWLSGILGAMIQHYLPKMLMERVPFETIYEEIPHVRQQLREEANQLIRSICGPVDGVGEAPKVENNPSTFTLKTAKSKTNTILAIDAVDKQHLGTTYTESILPFFDNPELPGSPLGNATHSEAFFQALYKMLPAAVHPTVESLENICEEQRQLTQQKKYYHVLHVWLILHVPLSIALVVLGGIHAVMALQY